MPFSTKEANIVMAYPQMTLNNMEFNSELWTNFFKLVCDELKQPLKITDPFHINHYLIGSCKYPRIGNNFILETVLAHSCHFWGLGNFLHC